MNRAEVGRGLVACLDALVLTFGKQVQFQTVFGLQVNDQLVHPTAGCLKNSVRCGAKIDLNVTFARGQTFACANVEGHASPTPIGNFCAQRYKGFGAAVGVDASFLVVAIDRLAMHIARAVLAAHYMLAQCFGGPRFEGAQDFEFLIANGVGMRIDGRLHGNGAQQLQCVVLHHVAQGAGVFIKRTALFDTQLFGNGDLNVGNVLTAPQGFKQGIAKTHGKQVLYRRLAQVVVNSENLVLFKDLAHALVDELVGLEVVAQRLFQNDASFGGVQFGYGQLFAHCIEQAGRSGQVHHHVVCFTFGQAGG